MEFGKRNAILVLLDINEEANKKTQQKLKENGFVRTHVYTVDLTSHEALQATARQIKNDVGLVSMVIMAAAPTFKPKSILDTNYIEDIDAHFKISYLSQLWTIQEFLKSMIINGGGHFVTISSTSALADIPLISSYASMKLAQTKLMETLRAELYFNGVKNVKTSIVYLAVLTGGIANGFQDSFEFDTSIQITAEQAANAIANGVLRNRENIYLPKWPTFLMLPLKHLLTPRISDFITYLKVRMNTKYLRLKHCKLE